MKRPAWILSAAGGLVVIGLAAWWAISRLRGDSGVLRWMERRAQPDPEALEAREKRVAGPSFDLDRLKELETVGHKPLVEYLTYIQVRRKEGDSLLFVRNRDVDVLAALAGTTRQEFVEEYQKLGVLLSLN